MPLVRIDLKRGKTAPYRRAVADSVYAALRQSFDVPDEDRFVLVTEHDDANFIYSPTYLDIARSDDLVFIQITVSNTRNVATKKALFRSIVEKLAHDPGLRPADVFVNLVEVVKENWSFGDGIAQYVPD